MAKKVIISCENAQELCSLITILEEVDAQFFYFDVANFYSQVNIIPPKNWTVFPARQIFDGKFSELGLFKRYMNYIAFAVQLLLLILRLRPVLLVVGVPLVFFRLQRFFFARRFKVISVLRSVVFGCASDVRVSRFKRLFMRLGLVGYSADVALCVGESTARFARSQNFDEVLSVGPFDADGYLNKHPACGYAYLGDYDVLVFIGAAYSWHGDYDSELQQSICLSDLKAHCARLGKRFIYLEHPRGNVAHEASHELDVIRGGVPACLDLIEAHQGRVYFVSMVSTMSFELSYLGFPCCFYVTDAFLNKYSSWYLAQANMVFTDLSKIDFGRGYVDFSSVFESRYKGHVCKEASSTIKGFLLS